MLKLGHARLICLIFGVIILFSLLSFRLVEVALRAGDENEKKSWVSQSYQPDYGRREIVDRNGELIATNLTTSSIYAKPKEILDINEAAFAVTSVFPDIKRAEILEKLHADKSFIWLKRNITPKQLQAIHDKGIPGIYYQNDERRTYVHGNLFAHVLGYVGIDGKGLAGLEKFKDKELSGSKDDKPLQLALDLRLQHIVHDELQRQVQILEAKGAAGIIMDARTSEVLAMVSLPDFDPNNPGSAPADAKFNRATLGVFELGSTFKSFTLAMGLDSGAISRRETYNVKDPIKVGRFKINDFHPKKTVLSVPEVLMYSSNIGAARIALKVGGNLQQQYLRSLGLMSQVSIELPERGMPLFPREWKEVSTMTVGFGHGIAVTPMHLATAMVPIVDGGIIRNPTLLKRDPQLLPEGRRVLDPKTSAQMRELLRLVVEHGTGGNANTKGYHVGGKTGTSEKIGSDGRYIPDAVLSSFVGAFPMNDPRYIIYVMIDEPKPKQESMFLVTGGWVAAPVVNRIITRLAPVLDLIPDAGDEDMPRRFFVNYEAPGSSLGVAEEH